ncbi:unnamed protein product [Ectocarpus fasciculatus]
MPQQSPSTTTANPVIRGPLFALEDVVLYIFVRVQSFFVWILSSVYSRAMAVPVLSNVLRPLSPPRLAAGSPAAPPPAADLASAPARSSGNYGVSGSWSAWSTRGRLAEGLLSAVVLVHAVEEWTFSSSALAALLVGAILRLSLLFAVLGGLSELWRLWHVSSHVDGRTCNVERYGMPENHVLNGVDIFEYDYFQKRSNFNARMCKVLGLFYFSSAGVDILNVVMDDSFAYRVVRLIIVLPWIRVSGKFIFGDETYQGTQLFTLKNLCVNQPKCRHVRTFLLARGTIYVVLLHLSPVPSKWAWSLIVTHSTRLLNVLVALQGHAQGVADAAAEIVEHVPEAL